MSMYAVALILSIQVFLIIAIYIRYLIYRSTQNQIRRDQIEDNRTRNTRQIPPRYEDVPRDISPPEYYSVLNLQILRNVTEQVSTI